MRSGLRVLHVVDSCNIAGGGVQEAIVQFHAAAVRAGDVFDIASFDDPNDPCIGDFPAPVCAIGPRYTRFAYAPKAIPWLKERVVGYDAIVSHGIWHFHSYAVHRACMSRSVPYFVFPHGMLDPWFKRTYPLKHIKKWMTWPWSDYPALRDAARVLFTAEDEARLAAQSFWLYAARNATVPLGILGPATKFDSIELPKVHRWPALANGRYLLFLGRIHPKKGVDVLIEAFARVAERDPTIDLAIAGNDQVGARASLEALAVARGISHRIQWLGEVRGEAKWELLRAAEAFVLPSHMENFCIAAVEAMACGVPVLLSDKINIWREVDADRAGLIGTDDVQGFSRVLERWLTMSREDRYAMGRRARAAFESRYQIDRAYEHLAKTIRVAIEMGSEV